MLIFPGIADFVHNLQFLSRWSFKFINQDEQSEFPLVKMWTFELPLPSRLPDTGHDRKAIGQIMEADSVLDATFFKP